MNHEWTILEYDKARDRIKRDTVGIKVQLFLNRYLDLVNNLLFVQGSFP